MVFAHLLPPEKVAEIADAMVAQWDGLLDEIDGCLADPDAEMSPGMRFAAGYGRTVMRAARQYVADNKAPLLETIAEETASQEAAD